MRFGHNQYQQQKYSAIGFQAQLKKAFEDNASSVNYYVQYSVMDHEATNQLSHQLMENQKAIGQLIGHFYGVKQKLAGAFAEWMAFTSEAIDIFRWRKNVDQFRKSWYERTDDLIQVLNAFNEWSLRDIFYKQIALTESLIQAHIRKESKEQIYFYNLLVRANIEASAVISSAIINKNKELFS